MTTTALWSRVLFPLGLAGIVVGSLDPLEGSLLILPGTGLLALDAHLIHARHVRLLTWAFALVTVGVAAVWVLSSFGGIRLGGGTQGLAPWWGLLILPYPVGWAAAIVGAWRSMTAHRQGEDRGTRPAT